MSSLISRGLSPALHCGLEWKGSFCPLVKLSQFFSTRESFVLLPLKRFYSILPALPNFDPLVRTEDSSEEEGRQFLTPHKKFSWTHHQVLHNMYSVHWSSQKLFSATVYIQSSVTCTACSRVSTGYGGPEGPPSGNPACDSIQSHGVTPYTRGDTGGQFLSPSKRHKYSTIIQFAGEYSQQYWQFGKINASNRMAR